MERLTGVMARHTRHTGSLASVLRRTALLPGDVRTGAEDDLSALYTSHTEPSRTGNGLRAENWCTMPQAGHRLYLQSMPAPSTTTMAS